MDDEEGLFEEIREFPDPAAAEVLASLVGLGDLQNRLLKHFLLVLDPDRMVEWSRHHYGKRIALVDTLADRSSLFIFAGDVGTGKTALAESIGDAIARLHKIPVTLFRLSLNVRGSGAVGQMTKRIGEALSKVRERGLRASNRKGKPSACYVLLIDEADALAQSRDLGQMHHEDRAGVNALIRGVDSLAVERIPAVVILCTNRLEAIDPAVRRRAAETLEFNRPDEEQRLEVLQRALADTGLTSGELRALVQATGPNGRTPGFTYSDIRQRLLPLILLDAFPDNPVRFQRILEIARSVEPTPLFQSARNG